MLRQNSNFSLLLKSVLLGLVMLFPLHDITAQIQHSSVQIPVGNSDTNGFARLDKEFYKLPLGNGKSVDLFFMFSTDPRIEPTYMGAYWSIPFFDSKIIKLSAKTYRWIAPNLKTYTFNKATKPERGFKETYILNTTGQLKLNISRDDSVHIINTKIPNFKFVIKDNKISTFCVGDNSDTFKITYDGSNRPQTIYNTTKNKLEFKFLYSEHKLLSQITFIPTNKNVFIKYGANTKLRTSLKVVLNITFVDGNFENYTYSQRLERQDRTILSKKGEKLSLAKVPINRFEQKYKDSESSQFIEWDATTGIITSDSGGVYSIRNPMFDQYSPEYSNSDVVANRKRELRTKESRISYKKPEYKYPEIWDYSLKTAIKITQNPHTGEQTRTSYIGNPGNNSMKIRKIEQRAFGSSLWKVKQSKAYDHFGNLIRETDEFDNVTTYIYKYSNGISYYSKYKNGLLMEEQHRSGRNLILNIKRIGNRTLKTIINKEKQLDFIDEQCVREIVFEKDIPTEVITYDKNNNPTTINKINIKQLIENIQP